MAMMQILFRMSIQGSIIIGIILLLRMVFRGRSRMSMDFGGHSRSRW